MSNHDLFDKDYKFIPFNIRLAAIHIANVYEINGLADVGYIANTIAQSLNLGDGKSNFYNGKEELKTAKVHFREEQEVDIIKFSPNDDIWNIVDFRYGIPYARFKVSITYPKK